MKTIHVAAGFVAALCASAPLYAHAEGSAGAELKMSTVIQDLEAKNYRVTDVDADGGLYEIEFIKPDGQKFESFVDAATGRVIHERIDN